MNIAMNSFTLVTVATLTILFSHGANAAGYAWFQRPTDTISAAGQTVLSTTSPAQR
ncbi:MAG: hypothetical protein WCQ21_31605 [Verrucomicrobiota bacterium]